MIVGFVTSRMHGGGAQKVFLNLINYLCESTDHEVHLILFKCKPNDKYLSQLNSRCKISVLNSSSKFGWYFLSKVLKEIKPQILFSTLNYINISVSLAYKISRVKSKLILREARTLEKSSFAIRIFQRIFYPKTSYHWAITPVIKEELMQLVNIKDNKIIVAPNPLANSVRGEDFNVPDVNNIRLLYVGRLIESKNISSLLNGLGRIKSKNWSLRIVGDGNEKENLVSLSKKLFLSDKVFFEGAVDDPNEVMRNCDIFCFPSLSEGFPNVVTEAMSNGNLCIANDSFGGGVRFIKKYANSVIIINYNNTEEVAEIIEYYLKRPDLLLSEKSRSFHESKNFEIETIFKNYFNDFFL